jgi:hypothetical protein
VSAERDYERSNLILAIDYMPSPRTCRVAQDLLSIDPARRGPLSQQLLDLMADELKVPRVRLHFHDKPQKHRRSGGRLTYKEYAYYDAEEGITVYNKTAVRQQYLAPKSYLDTIVHEFLHHLDYELLKLRHTYHTQGFYSRLGDLMGKLLGRLHTQLDLFGPEGQASGAGPPAGIKGLNASQ